MNIFILIGTITKILNRRIEKKIEHQQQINLLKHARHPSMDPFNLSLLSVLDTNQRETGKQHEEAWSD